MYYKIGEWNRLKVIRKLLLNAFSILEENGFQKSPFKDSNFGQYYPGYNVWEFCKLSNDKLILIKVSQDRKSPVVVLKLDVFKLYPIPKTINDLYLSNSHDFFSEPANSNEITLCCYPAVKRGISPRWDSDVILRLRPKYFQFWNFQYDIKKFEKQIEGIFSHINQYIDFWESRFVPYITNWNGELNNIQLEGSTPIKSTSYRVDSHNCTNNSIDKDELELKKIAEQKRKRDLSRLNLLNNVMVESFKILEKYGFKRSILKNSRFGKVGAYKFEYMFYKIENQMLMTLDLSATMKSNRIKARLNIFSFKYGALDQADLHSLRIPDDSTAEYLDGKLSLLSFIKNFITTPEYKFKFEEFSIKPIIKLKLYWALLTLKRRVKKWLCIHTPIVIDNKGNLIGHEL